MIESDSSTGKFALLIIYLNQERLVGQIRAVEICMKMGVTVQNTLKEGGTEQRGGNTKILKRGMGQAGSMGGCLKKGEGLEPPYEL